MSDDRDDDGRIEDLLAVYRPARPPAGLRERVLAAVPAAPQRAPWLPLAAALTVAALLQWAAANLDARIAASLGAAFDGVPSVDPALLRLGAPLRYVELHRPPAREPEADEASDSL